MDYRITVTGYAVHPVGSSINSEHGYTVEVEDEGAGPFVVVRGQWCDKGEVRIGSDCWPSLRDMIEAAMAECGHLDKDAASNE